jgi:RNA polymerase sigma-70 factor (ECF subfamily)
MRREDVERFYDEYAPALVAYASAVLGARIPAEDVVHQVFLNLLRGTGGEPDDPRSYLYRAVRNGALNARRSTRREVELGETVPWLVAPSGSREDALAVQAALLELPVEQREIIVLRVWAQMTLEEAAALIEISPNTAASRYRYGLEKLRQRLQPQKVREHAVGR